MCEQPGKSFCCPEVGFFEVIARIHLKDALAAATVSAEYLKLLSYIVPYHSHDRVSRPLFLVAKAQIYFVSQDGIAAGILDPAREPN